MFGKSQIKLDKVGHGDRLSLVEQVGAYFPRPSKAVRFRGQLR